MSSKAPIEAVGGQQCGWGQWMLLASDDQRELEASLLEIPVGEPELKGISTVTLEFSPDVFSISADIWLGVLFVCM